MKNLKKSSNILYIVCTFIMVLMIARYFESKNLKGTYKCTNKGYTQKIPQITDITKTNNSAYNPYACYTRNDTNGTRV